MKKCISIAIILAVTISLLFSMSVTSNAAVNAEQIVTGTDGSIDYLIKGLTLDSSKTYQYAVETTKGATITNWYEALNPDFSNGIVRISLNVNNKNQLAVLKAGDTAYLTIREKDATSNLVTDHQLDLTLPLLKAFSVNESSSGTIDSWPAFGITPIYGIQQKEISFLFEKINDSSIINGYIDNNHDLSSLTLKGRDSFPSVSNTAWKSTKQTVYPDGSGVISAFHYAILNNQLPPDDGLYYLWLMGGNEEVKTVLGQAVVEVGEVKKVSSTSGGGTTTTTTTPGTTTTATSATTTGTSGTTTSSAGTTSTYTAPKTDPDSTVATTSLPKAGVSVMIGIVIIALAGGAIYTYIRQRGLKGID